MFKRRRENFFMAGLLYLLHWGNRYLSHASDNNRQLCCSHIDWEVKLIQFRVGAINEELEMRLWNASVSMATQCEGELRRGVNKLYRALLCLTPVSYLQTSPHTGETLQLSTIGRHPWPP